MVFIVKSEWHQLERRFGVEFDEEIISQIYPDLDEAGVAEMLAGIASGEVDIDEVINHAYDVDLDWDWLDEDDLWTDRKGGYEVTYQVVEKDEDEEEHTFGNPEDFDDEEDYDNDEEELTEQTEAVPVILKHAEWPFPAYHETNTDNPIDFPKEELVESTEEESQTTEELLPNYPPGEYIIRIWGRTREIGVGTITKEQYDYWNQEDMEDYLSDAMNENYDYDENETPEEARFEHPYYEYNNVTSFWGFDEDMVMTIENQAGEEIFNGDLSGFVNQAHGETQGAWEASEEVEELYPDYLGKGYFVMWTQGGKGSCMKATIVTDDQEFDPRKLKYTTWDINGASCVNSISYDDQELDDEGMDSDRDNWRGQWSEFNIYHNEQ
jgi:hypothetical protein